MSGYFAMLRCDAKHIDETLVENVKMKLSARGPDGSNVWTNGRIGGSFTLLLSGPAEQARTQPQSLAARYFLWGHVRLDDRTSLICELARLGDPVKPEASSEELLLHAWQRWGESCLQKIIGDFSFGLWDAQAQCLWGARDFVGLRPFYYACVGGVFCFCNTLEALRDVPEVSTALDEQFIGDFLLKGCSLDPERTVFRDTKRLLPGHVLKFQHGRVETRRFFKLPIEEPLHLSDPVEYIQTYRALLREAVTDRLPKNRAALYLSGGLDSSSVCAVATEIARERGQTGELKAFTTSWTQWLYDEEPALAKITAAHLGIRHEILEDAKLELFEDGETSGLRTPEPSEEPLFARTLREYQRISQHSHVVLSGDGGDNILTGQAWPYLVYLWTRRNWSQILRDFGGFVWSHRRIPPLRAGFKSRIQRAFRGTRTPDEYPVWLNEEFEQRTGLRQRWQQLHEERTVHEHPFHPQAYAALHGTYWASVLETEDPGWTGVPLETRAPLLDLRIVRFLLNVPPIPWCADKELSRQSMKPYLPECIIRRPKRPLSQDPVSICLERWSPRLKGMPTDNIRPFVRWEKWQGTFQDGRGSLTQGTLRPLSLLYWMKSVENGRSTL